MLLLGRTFIIIVSRMRFEDPAPSVTQKKFYKERGIVTHGVIFAQQSNTASKSIRPRTLPMAG